MRGSCAVTSSAICDVPYVLGLYANLEFFYTLMHFLCDNFSSFPFRSVLFHSCMIFNLKNWLLLSLLRSLPWLFLLYTFFWPSSLSAVCSLVYSILCRSPINVNCFFSISMHILWRISSFPFLFFLLDSSILTASVFFFCDPPGFCSVTQTDLDKGFLYILFRFYQSFHSIEYCQCSLLLFRTELFFLRYPCYFSLCCQR